MTRGMICRIIGVLHPLRRLRFSGYPCFKGIQRDAKGRIMVSHMIYKNLLWLTRISVTRKGYPSWPNLLPIDKTSFQTPQKALD